MNENLKTPSRAALKISSTKFDNSHPRNSVTTAAAALSHSAEKHEILKINNFYTAKAKMKKLER